MTIRSAQERPMLFLDCEFNGHRGHLISMALVSDKGEEFYEVMPGVYHKDTVKWVRDNVLTKLGKDPLADEKSFRDKLQHFLTKHVGEYIVADSPADFWYLMDMVHEINEEGKYRYINLELDMKFIISREVKSENPHNALADARALKDWYIATFKKRFSEFRPGG